MLTQEDLKKLAAPFPDDVIGVKAQSFNRERTKVMLVLYVQHTDVYDRLESVDPAWSMKVSDEQVRGDTTFTRVALTVKGVTRENSGEGGDPKSAVSDAIKRAAMLFGPGRYLYDSDQVWVPYSEQDKYRKWTVAEYRAAASRFKAPPTAQATRPAAPGPVLTPGRGGTVHPAPKSPQGGFGGEFGPA